MSSNFIRVLNIFFRLFKKMDKKNLFIGVLCVLLLVSVGYIAWNLIQQDKANSLYTGYQQGYSDGVKATVYSLIQQTDSCRFASVNYGNYTEQVVNTACLTNSSR